MGIAEKRESVGMAEKRESMGMAEKRAGRGYPKENSKVPGACRRRGTA
jgi:hypothetical protein